MNRPLTNLLAACATTAAGIAALPVILAHAIDRRPR